VEQARDSEEHQKVRQCLERYCCRRPQPTDEHEPVHTSVCHRDKRPRTKRSEYFYRSWLQN